MRVMRVCLVLLAGVVSMRGVAMVGQDARVNAAQGAAAAWLALTDATRYGDSWRAASGVLQAAVSEEIWAHDLQTMRSPLGKVEARTLKSAVYQKTLQGAPDGEYVVVVYETGFAHRQSAVETVTAGLEKDGVWRVAGYVIR
jgi:hypothetical protein